MIMRSLSTQTILSAAAPAHGSCPTALAASGSAGVGSVWDSGHAGSCNLGVCCNNKRHSVTSGLLEQAEPQQAQPHVPEPALSGVEALPCSLGWKVAPINHEYCDEQG